MSQTHRIRTYPISLLDNSVTHKQTPNTSITKSPSKLTIPNPPLSLSLELPMSSLSLSSISSPLLPKNPSKPTIKNPARIKLPPLSATGKRYKGTAMREEKLTEMIEKKVAEAMEVCRGDEAKGSDGCRVAWDEVEEVSQAKADLRRRIAESEADPLESFCEENPETDECRVYKE